MADFILGDSRKYVVDLQINNAGFVIAPSDTVKAAIVMADKKTALSSAPVTLSSTADGADWSTGKVVVKFPRESTEGVTVTGKAFLEIQATIGEDDWTWHIQVNLVPGTI